MKLHGHPTGAGTRQALTTLAEKAHEVDFILVDITRGETPSPEHLALQPFGELPVLEDGAFSLYGAGAICRYLDEKLPGPSLVPATLPGRGLMEQFLHVEQAYFSGPATTLARDRTRAGRTPDKEPGAVIEQALFDIARPLEVLDQALEGQQYLAGSFSLADLFYMPHLEGLFQAGHGALVTSRHHLAAWWGRLGERPSWKKIAGG